LRQCDRGDNLVLPQRVEGRSCGTCTACCEFPPIRTEQLQKPANTLCSHCVEGRGCTVYDVRPDVCRGFFCGWFFVPELSPAWHPSESGVIIRVEHIGADTVTLLVLRLSPFLLSEDFAGMVGAWVEQGLGVEFERVGPPGHLPAKMRMNELLEEAVRARDLREMHKIFAWSLAHIDQTHIWEADDTVLRSSLA
jgi:hypothetical protein